MNNDNNDVGIKIGIIIIIFFSLILLGGCEVPDVPGVKEKDVAAIILLPNDLEIDNLKTKDYIATLTNIDSKDIIIKDKYTKEFRVTNPNLVQIEFYDGKKIRTLIISRKFIGENLK